MRYRWLPIAGALFLVIAMTIQFVLSYQRNRADITERIDYKMELAQKDVIYELHDMCDAVSDIATYLPQYIQDTTTQHQMIESVLWRYPNLFSCYICYVPHYFPNQGEYYAICAAHIQKDSIISYHFEDMVDYYERDWYKGAMQSGENGYWSRSYNDIDTDSLIFTYSLKACDDYGNVFGVAGADYTLSWTKQLLQDTRPYDDAVCQLYGLDGTLIVQTGEMSGEDDWIISEKKLSPAEMVLMIGVPSHHLWDGIVKTSLITFITLIIGILVAGILIRRLWSDQEAYARVETENRLMEQELQIASGIQRGILKSRDECRQASADGDIEVQAVLEPMREVGGDLYDFYRKGEDLYFIIGDVSGKSVPAAMFMSATVNLFRSAVQRLRSPKAIMEEMNSVLSENNPSMMFVTAFIGRLHIPTGLLLYCNAGHLSPQVVSEHAAEHVRGLDLIPNIPMGYDGTFRFEEQGTMLGEGDSIVLYTDGITEARNARREMLGLARWRDIIGRQPGSIRCYDLQEEVKSFMVDTVPTDDITLMVIRKTSGVEPVAMRVENKMDRWPALRAAVHEYGLCVGIEKRTLKKLELALEEAVVNIVHYSQATEIGLRVEIRESGAESQFCIRLSDDGIAFDPTAQASADTEKVVAERQIGGLGITLLKQIADDLQYRREGEKNLLTIVKSLNC